MKIKILIMTFILLVSFRVAEAETWDLGRYVSAVRAHSKDLKIADSEKDLAEVRKKQAISSALPFVGMQAGYTRSLSDYYMYFDMSALMPGANGVAKAPFKRDNEYTASIMLRQKIFDPGVGCAIKAAEQYGSLTDFAFQGVEQTIVTNARKLFYKCLLLDRIHDVASASEINARDNYENVKKKYDTGQVSLFELLQAETRWRSAIPETRKALRDLHLITNTLKNLAGIDIDEKIELDGSLSDTPELPDEKPFDEILKARPDFQALVWKRELLETGVKAAKRSFIPTISGNLGYTYSAQSNQFEIDEENKYWFVGVELSCPIYTGGYRTAEVQKAKAELVKARIGIDKTRESIVNELSNVLLRLDEASARIKSAKATLRAAKQAFTIAETTTRSGLSTQLQLKDARLGYDGAQLSYFVAIYDYLDAYFDWELMTGTAK